MKITSKDEDTDLVWPLTFEKKVDVFYHQALGWQLHIADLISNGGREFGSGRKVASVDHSGFAVLQIYLSYLETIGKHQGVKRRDGKKLSEPVHWRSMSRLELAGVGSCASLPRASAPPQVASRKYALKGSLRLLSGARPDKKLCEPPASVRPTAGGISKVCFERTLAPSFWRKAR